MARPVKSNKNVVQSYVLTVSRYDFSLHEKRIMYRLVEIAQEELKGRKLKDIAGCRIERNSSGDIDIEMPIRAILSSEEDTNYAIAKKAFKSFANRTIEQTQGNTWMLDHLIERPRINSGTGIAKFRVSPDVWNIILDFTKGYRKYELKTTMQFRSVYSMRFYELMSGQKKPLTYDLGELRAMLCLENKFKAAPDFERYVLNVAQAEMDEHSPYSFTYKRETIKSRGRAGEKVVGYTFTPKLIVKNQDLALEEKSLQARLPITQLIPGDVYRYLLNKGITKEQMTKNKDTLHNFCLSSPDIFGQLAVALGRAREKDNEFGYFVNTLKGMTKDNNEAKK